MARIRTIKPEFFRHSELFYAEKETGLPLRVAFAALFTVADREGRFKWRPIEIKLDCLPYDDVDFEDVLDALVKYGFIQKYHVGGKAFACIPSWEHHQIINNKERKSDIPHPFPNENDESLLDQDLSRDGHALTTRDLSCFVIPKGKGREKERKGKGREGEGERKGKETLVDVVFAPSLLDQAFQEFWDLYPRKVGKQAAQNSFHKVLGKSPHLLAKIKESLAEQSQQPQWRKDGGMYIPHPATWLNQGRWDDELVNLPSEAIQKNQEYHQYIEESAAAALQILEVRNA